MKSDKAETTGKRAEALRVARVVIEYETAAGLDSPALRALKALTEVAADAARLPTLAEAAPVRHVEIVRLWAEGWLVREIARAVGMSVPGVVAWVGRHRDRCPYRRPDRIEQGRRLAQHTAARRAAARAVTRVAEPTA